MTSKRELAKRIEKLEAIAIRGDGVSLDLRVYQLECDSLPPSLKPPKICGNCHSVVCECYAMALSLDKPPKQPTPCVCGAVPERKNYGGHGGPNAFYRGCNMDLCGVRGPIRDTPEEADAAWEELRGALPECVVELIRATRSFYEGKSWPTTIGPAIKACANIQIPEPTDD